MNTVAIILDLQNGKAAIFCGNLDVSCTSINTILKQLFKRGCRAVNNFTSCYSVNNFLAQPSNTADIAAHID